MKKNRMKVKTKNIITLSRNESAQITNKKKSPINFKCKDCLWRLFKNEEEMAECIIGDRPIVSQDELSSLKNPDLNWQLKFLPEGIFCRTSTPGHNLEYQFPLAKQETSKLVDLKENMLPLFCKGCEHFVGYILSDTDIKDKKVEKFIVKKNNYLEIFENESKNPNKLLPIEETGTQENKEMNVNNHSDLNPQKKEIDIEISNTLQNLKLKRSAMLKKCKKKFRKLDGIVNNIKLWINVVNNKIQEINEKYRLINTVANINSLYLY